MVNHQQNLPEIRASIIGRIEDKVWCTIEYHDASIAQKTEKIKQKKKKERLFFAKYP